MVENGIEKKLKEEGFDHFQGNCSTERMIEFLNKFNTQKEYPYTEFFDFKIVPTNLTNKDYYLLPNKHRHEIYVRYKE